MNTKKWKSEQEHFGLSTLFGYVSGVCLHFDLNENSAAGTRLTQNCVQWIFSKMVLR